MVGDHGVHLCKADGLDGNTGEHLLIAEGEEEFSWDLGGVR